MRKIFFTVILVAVLPFQRSSAQNFYSATEFGAAAGGSQYFGDLNDDYGFHYVRPAFGAFGRLHLNPYIAVRAAANYTKVGYEDRFSTNIYNRKRNLSFRSDIMELVLQAEFNFFRFSTGELGSRFTPYLTGGVGAFYYNPYAILNNKRYNLRQIGTEGQNLDEFKDRKYSSFSVCFPVGVGVKYWMRPGMNVGFEIADRLTLTDYVDDVSNTYIGSDHFPTDPMNPNPGYILQDRSVEIDATDPLGRAGKQRGNSTTKDQYLMFMVHLSFQLKVYKCPDYYNRGWSEFSSVR